MARGRQSKLSDDDVREILAMPPASDWEWVAGLYGVSVGYVQALRSGAVWRGLRVRHQMQQARP